MSTDINDYYKQDPVPEDSTSNTNPLDNPPTGESNVSLSNDINREDEAVVNKAKDNNEAHQFTMATEPNVHSTNNNTEAQEEPKVHESVEVTLTDPNNVLHQSSNSIEVPYTQAAQISYKPPSRNNHDQSIKQSNTSMNTSFQK